MRGVPGGPEIGLDCGPQHDFHFWGRSGAFGGLVGLRGGAWGRFLVPREALWEALEALWGAFWCPGEPFLGGFERTGILCTAFELNFGKVVRKFPFFDRREFALERKPRKVLFFQVNIFFFLFQN